jgi:hypothetical protein
MPTKSRKPTKTTEKPLNAEVIESEGKGSDFSPTMLTRDKLEELYEKDELHVALGKYGFELLKFADLDDEDAPLEKGFTKKERERREKFNSSIAVLLVGDPWHRLASFHVEAPSETRMGVSTNTHVKLVARLHSVSLDGFMRSKGCTRVGEEAFNRDGQRIAVITDQMQVGREYYAFPKLGMYFYEPEDAKSGGDKVAIRVYEGDNDGTVEIYCREQKTANAISEELNQYVRNHNVLRGAKMRNISISDGTFENVEPQPEKTWDNYYYSQNIRDLFGLEVFGFVRQMERYNKSGITKRGIMLHGEPGTGKTTLGHIICNEAEDATVMWVTADTIAENTQGKYAVKNLYLLAEYVAPVIVILEDLDLFSEDREGKVDSGSLGTLMNILDGVHSIKNAITVATTNRVELIEKALSNRPGRFDRVVKVGAMNDANREKMFKRRLENYKVDDGVIEFLVDQSNGWTGALMNEAIISLNLHFISNDDDSQDQVRHVTQEIAEKVVGVVSVSTLDQQKKKKSGYFHAS